MSIKKFVVAGLVVVGLVGAVNAQATWSPDKTVPATNSMDVIYNVQLLASIDVTPKPLTSAGLMVDASDQTLAGNLGQVVVRTNYNKWDVAVKAANNCVLRYTETTGGGGFGVPPTSNEEALMKAGSSGLDTAYLNVYIGIVNAARTGFETGTWTDFTDSLKAGETSFAEAIGDALGASGNYNSQLGATGTNNIHDNKFDVPATDGGVLFYVNAGLGTPTTTKITGNGEGNYKETLTFTLTAAF